ncbi:MAG: hypothetical protein HQL30_01845 [Candidatus Omnitrophica bacterium]|nr:hypothetical protein [Candidatus Omnitrophota bacterium]
MNGSDWPSKKQLISQGEKISLRKKLEGLRLMNEVSDKALTLQQKVMRRQIRENQGDISKFLNGQYL